MKLARRGAPKPRRYRQVARAETAEATGRRIVQAFLARLMREWFDAITLDRVAADAGVTVQTVVRRFGGKRGLLASAVEILGEEVEKRRTAPEGDLATIVEHLVRDYEETGDAVVRLLALEPRVPDVRPVLELGRRRHRAWVTRVFAPWLGSRSAAAHRSAIDALIVVTDVYTWKRLRREMDRSVRATVETMTLLVRATLAALAPPAPHGGPR